MDINPFSNPIPSNIDEIIEAKRQEDPTIDENPIKLIDTAHEIIFTVTAHALSQNEKGELIDSKEISVRNYHIPVPIDKDYKHYMHVFFSYLEEKIVSAIHEANKKSNDNESVKE